jgi:hypothetical protein
VGRPSAGGQQNSKACELVLSKAQASKSEVAFKVAGRQGSGGQHSRRPAGKCCGEAQAGKPKWRRSGIRVMQNFKVWAQVVAGSSVRSVLRSAACVRKKGLLLLPAQPGARADQQRRGCSLAFSIIGGAVVGRSAKTLGSFPCISSAHVLCKERGVFQKRWSHAGRRLARN